MTMLFLLPACKPDATIEVEGADPVDVASVAWTLPQQVDVWTYTGAALESAGASQVFGSIVFSSAPDACANDLIETWGAASIDLLGASAQGTDTAAFCEAVPDFLVAMADADAEHANGPAQLQTAYCIGTDCTGAIAATSYPFGTVSTSVWTGSLLYVDPGLADGVYERALAAWNVANCAFDPSFVEGEADATETWGAVDGDITFDTAAAEHVEGTIFADFRDTHQNTATVTGSFAVDLCEVAQVDTLVYLL
jgi:hypothetical protein